MNRAHALQRVQGLLKIPAALEKLREGLDPKDIERLKAKVREGPQGLLQDPAWAKLLDQWRTTQTLTSEDADLLNRLAQSLPRNLAESQPPAQQPVNPAQETKPQRDAPSLSPGGPAVTPTPGPPPPEASVGRPPSWLTRQMLQLADRLDKVDHTESQESLGALLRQMARMQPAPTTPASPVLQRFSAVSTWAGQLGEALPPVPLRPERLLSALRGWRLPSLPGSGWRSSGLPRSPPRPASRAAAIAQACWESSCAWRSWRLPGSWLQVVCASRRAQEQAEDLGPWPVRPDAVRTRAT